MEIERVEDSVIDNDNELKDEKKEFKTPELPFASNFKTPCIPSRTVIETAKGTEANDCDQESVNNTPDNEIVQEESQTSSIPDKSSIHDKSSIPVTSSIPDKALVYQEPSWGGVPEGKYFLEILKNGTVVQTVKLEGKSYFTIGRLSSCDLFMEHPSLSRHHAVLQFKNNPSPEKPVGFYLFDLDSTHGSWHNKNKCFPRTYYRLRVGHMLKFGGSTRTVLLGGPEEDVEEESEMTVTELKERAADKARKRQEEEEEKRRKLEELEDERMEAEKSRGVSWGIVDDTEGDEKFPDMEKNPFAELANNESLYVEDPKKCLKNWFEREGYDIPEYTVEEKGPANFYCRIDLPVDGQPNFAEAQVKGKKKEAIIQAALEACRILDRLGVLRPSQQTRMERKVKKWEEDDFYASDEDEFLDRTGDIEQKRRKRMKMAGMGGDTVETYDSLMEKHKNIETEIIEVEAELKKAVERRAKAEKLSDDGDLDNYLSQLKKGAQVDKETVTKLKVRLNGLVQDKERLVKLINITKPATMPELKSNTLVPNKPKPSIMIGKRGSKGLLGKVKSVSKESVPKPILAKSEQTVVLEAFLEQDEEKTKKVSDGADIQPIGYDEKKPDGPEKVQRIGDTRCNERKLGPFIPDHVRESLISEKEGNNEERIDSNEKENAINSTGQMDLDTEVEQESQKKSRGDRGSKRRAKKIEDFEEEDDISDYNKLSTDNKYDVWMPPKNQSGDGKTSLNEKLGY